MKMEDEKTGKFTDSIDELIREFESSGSIESKELVKAIQLQQKAFTKSLSDLQESLDYLRICIKYQVFDLEATRRENVYLKKLLSEDFDDDEYGTPEELIG